MKKPIILVLYFCLITTIDAQVTPVWQYSLGGMGVEYAKSVISNNSGGYILAGYTNSNNLNVSGNHGGNDVWMVEVAQNGNHTWQRCYGGADDDRAESIIKTYDGGYVFAGATSSSSGDVSGRKGMYDMWVVKLNAQKDIEWQKCLGGSAYDWAYSIIQTFDSCYVVTGYSRSGDGDLAGIPCPLMDNIWLVKLNQQGDILWQRCLGGNSAETGFSVIQTSAGDLLVVGETVSNDSLVTGNHGGVDILAIKLNSQGNVLWHKCYGGSGNEQAYSVIQALDGSYVIVGATNSNNGNVSGQKGGYDVWVIKVNDSGNIIWQKCLGGTSYDRAQSVCQSAEGDFYITGNTHSNNYDVTDNHGNSDFWIVKINNTGNLIWQKCMGGTATDVAYSIMKSADGSLVVAGTSNSINGDITCNLGSNDMWVVKMIECNISGIIFHDLNVNGIKDSLEQGVGGHMVLLNPGNIFTFTNNNGYYYFRGDSGVNYTIQYIAAQYWYETTNNYLYNLTLDSINQRIDTLNFGVMSRINVNDVACSIIGSPARPFFNTNYWLSYKNWGTVTANGTIEFKYDTLLTYTNSSQPPLSHTGNTLIYAYDTLGPGTNSLIRVSFQVPGIQYLGHSLHLYSMINPLIPDTHTTNNYDTLHQVITGSYDPNDKLVSPEGYGSEGMVLLAQRLSYTIRFQNSGTDTAFTVVVRDTIHTNLDVSTFILEAYSHPVICQINGDNEFVFTFNNILLPDSNVNEPGSHGFVRYSISPKSGLTDKSTATNTAYIYFDYNPAVVTNTILNTFVANITVAKPLLGLLRTVVFPNPSSDYIYFKLPENTNRLEVYSSDGKMVLQSIPQKQMAEINVKNLSKGLYVVKIYCGQGVSIAKFLKD